MNCPNSLAAAFLACLVPLAAALICAAKCGLWRRLKRSTNHWQRALALVVLALVAGYGGDKPNPQPSSVVLQLLTVLRDGSLKDVRGRVVSGTQAAALDAFAAEAGQIAAALSNVVEAARQDCIDLTNQLAQGDYSAAYIALDMPRGTPVETNHNIMVGFEQVTQTPSNLTALVWFSDPPATNVNIRIRYSVAEGQWGLLDPTTNFWPATENVNGAECVRYVYAIPEGIAGTPLRPQYEVEFGGFAPDEYLSVPESGVTVQVGEVEYLPHTGWVTLGAGADAIAVRLLGGIAVEAVQNGTTYKGNNLL